MVDRCHLEQGLALTLAETDFPGLGERLQGKVRESYVKSDDEGRRIRTIVVTDRISAMDVLLGTIPFKGQVLNGIAAYWFEQTADLVPNHLLGVPDPSVSVVEECEVFSAEMIVRGYLTGSSSTSIWTHYDQGAREYCGFHLPDGMTKHQALPSPILTPTTKAPAGEHDELTTKQALIERGIFTAEQWEQVEAMCLELFACGSKLAAERGLILVDTKYELGRRADGTIVFVDEIHTPDSSRYWYASGYEEALGQGKDPRALDKEYLRRYLVDQGYRGDGPPPELPDEVRVEAAARYVEIFELVTGEDFVCTLEPPIDRIRRNLKL